MEPGEKPCYHPSQIPMPAKIRKNADGTLYEITTPDGEEYQEKPKPDENGEIDPYLVCNEGRSYLAVIAENDDDLKPGAVYELVPVETIVEENAEIEEWPEE
jgi:hypothetical protein